MEMSVCPDWKVSLVWSLSATTSKSMVQGSSLLPEDASCWLPGCWHFGGMTGDLVDEIIKEVGIPTDIMDRVEEGGTIAGKGAQGDVRGSFSKYADLTDRAIHVQKQIIRKLAQKEACVIIGRSADYILKDTEGIQLVRAFIYAPNDVRVHNIMESHNLSEKDAKLLLDEKDKRYHKRHLALTGSNRGDRHNRDILINSDFLGIQGTAEYLEDLIAKKYGKKEA